jgi:predicted ATPase/signal transduction histidine kinase
LVDARARPGVGARTATRGRGLSAELDHSRPDQSAAPRTRAQTATDGEPLRTLWTGHETILCRQDDRRLVRFAAPTCPPAFRTALLEAEMALASRLEASWAVMPVALERRAGQLGLVLEHPGGEPLERHMAEAPTLEAALSLSVALVAAVGAMHAAGLVHRGLRPEHVLYDAQAQTLRLTGFGHARLGSTMPEAAPLLPEDALPYLAPEQTGRLQLAIDRRADLYAVGVVLFRLVAGRAPFKAADPLAWIHAHLAQKPPDAEDVAGVPRPVSRLIGKLLAKAPDERYQTAAGVESDLRLCLAALRADGHIDDFPLGAFDLSASLVASGVVFGRDPELAVLERAWTNLRAGQPSAVVLLGGPAGVGKSSIVDAFGGAREGRGLIARGKGDQQKQGVPYGALGQALAQLAGHVMSLDAGAREPWRNKLMSALGVNAQAMVNLVPDLESILGLQKALAPLPPSEAEARFQQAFGVLLAQFATTDAPLTLVLDDLQWLDRASLVLLERLIANGLPGGLLLIGAYRSEEIHRNHPLQSLLNIMERRKAPGAHIAVSPLAREDVAAWLSSLLRWPNQAIEALASVLHDKTGGTPLAVSQFLVALVEDGLLTPDAGSVDLERVRRRPFADNMVTLMLAKLRALPEDSQEALKVLACLGQGGGADLLASLLDVDERSLESMLWQAAQAGLLIRGEQGYAFLHDRVQEAAYLAIEPPLRPVRHLMIGRAMIARDAGGEALFDIVHHFSQAGGLVIDRDEIQGLARLRLAAAERAMAAMAHGAARVYLERALADLGSDPWPLQDDLAFELTIRWIECLVQAGEHDPAEAALAQLARHTRIAAHSAVIRRAQADLLTMLGRFSDAVAVGLEGLAEWGQACPARPGIEDVRRQVERLNDGLAARALRDLALAPPMSDPGQLAIMDLLARVLPAALYTDRNLHSYLTIWMANLSLREGLADTSGLAFIVLSRVLGPCFGDYESGFRFGRFGYELILTRGPDSQRPSAYLCFAVFCNTWVGPARDSAQILREALAAAKAVGDQTYAAYSYNNLVANLLLTGSWLADVEASAVEGLAYARGARFGLAEVILEAQTRLVRGLGGRSSDMRLLGETVEDEAALLGRIQEQAGFELATCWFWVRKLQACVVAGDRAAARDAADHAEPLLWASAEFVELAEFHFHAAIARAGAAAEDRAALIAVRRHRDQLAVWARHCPETFTCRAQLVEAELRAVDGDVLGAQRLYETAIASARTEGFANVEALAAERAAALIAGQGLTIVAEAYRAKARDAYDRWGARGKVAQLEDAASAMGTAENRAAPPASLDALYVASVLRASQAVSNEILLDDLISKLMAVLLEQAGADRAVLFLARDGLLLPAAESHIDGDGQRLSVLSPLPTAAESAAPLSILHAALREREPVLIADARLDGAFRQDAYLSEARPRSVLALPLIKQHQVIGVAYLENRLTAGVFTPRQAAVLELLAGQAAISLENARLYSDLLGENRQRQDAETALRSAQGDLEHAARLTTMGELTASIAHELGQPLTSIVGNANACLRWLSRAEPNLERALQSAQAIVRDGKRAGEVVRSIRGLTKNGAGPKAEIDLNAALQEVLDILAGECARQSIAVQVSLAPRLPAVVADRVQVQQVFLNLILNAVQAMSHHAGRGVLKITSRIDGGEARIEIEDNGPGVSPDLQAKIFDAFYTTKAEGLGLGLSLCRSIVEGHGGRLTLRDAVPSGAVFEAALPHS